MIATATGSSRVTRCFQPVSDGFRALDVDGNNLLTFEEWAVTTARRFDNADADWRRAAHPA